MRINNQEDTLQSATKVDVEPAPEGQGLELNHDFLLSVPAGGIRTAESPVICLSYLYWNKKK
jgi:hypothetical protein